MEDYHRDSLREMRRMEREGQYREPERKRGSVFITLLIILLFLAAGGFYLKTEHPEWVDQYFTGSAVEQTLQSWKEDVAAVFSPQEDSEVKQTVDDALADQNESG